MEYARWLQYAVRLSNRLITFLLTTTLWISALFAAIVPYSIIRQASKAHVVLGWPISFLSLGVSFNPIYALYHPRTDRIQCCRLIMNLQTLRLDNGEAVSSRMELESYILNETRAIRENASLTVDIASEI